MDEEVDSVEVVVIEDVPARAVGIRARTDAAVVLTPARLLIYKGVLAVSVCTIEARAVFALFVCELARVVTPGVVAERIAAAVERDAVVVRPVVVGRVVALVVVRTVLVVGATVVVAVLAVTDLAGVVFEVRVDTLRPVVVEVATALDAAERVFELRGLTTAGTTGVLTFCSVSSAASFVCSSACGVSYSSEYSIISS